ncbi:hypothetical protein D9619_009035 [Psilocybe cf. subviscida]|uniref:D-arabinono-1,4-lactone oxidase n=1 Tax=Psilocybe cf. subviscida TaxID=2480587 RepID=A0A8H5BU31_9AGAR|nr:hypothetical protein D9619_009035 [Psilocybe cf. subviscida]
MGLGDIPLDNLYKQLEPITVPTEKARFTNWGLSFTCKPCALFEPENDFQCELILELARRERKRIRVAGIGHSPSDLACTSEYMLRTTKLNRVLEVNTEKRYVIAQAGIVLDDLHAELIKHKLAMTNLGSISDQTLGGVISTATHGTGIKYGVISTSVMALTLLLADGSRVTCTRTELSDLFTASLCGIGATGIILSIQLEVEPAFRLKEIQKPAQFDDVVDNLETVAQAAEHVRLWWYPTTDTIMCSESNRTDEAIRPGGNWLWDTLFGYHVVQLLLYLGRYYSPIITWTGNFACWLSNAESERVNDSHNIFNVNCRYPQHTTEWALPLENAPAALREFRNYLQKELQNPQGVRPHFPVEIRFSAPDNIWLSPSYSQRTCWIGIVQYKPYGTNVAYRKFFTAFEGIVERLGGRPHWAKAHLLKPEQFRTLYPHFNDFTRVLENVDPDGIFRNEYVQRHIEGKPVGSRVFKIRP